MNLSSFNHQLLCSVKEPEMDIAQNIFRTQQNQMKQCSNEHTSGHEMQEEQDSNQYEWRSNILISSTENRERSPFALRHLTSFEEKSMDKHGKRLSQSFKQYICWVRDQNYIVNYSKPYLSLSNLEWETVQGYINNQNLLTPQQKKTLISSAYKNTQAQLVISQIIEQIPQQYYKGVLMIAASLIKQFNQNELKGKEYEQIQNYISQCYIIRSGALHQRLCSLGMAKRQIKDHEKYFNFVRNWMQVFFLSLNGFLQNSQDRSRTLQSGTKVYQDILRRRKSSQQQ